MNLDDIVLIHDNRGISGLKNRMERNSYLKAAELSLQNIGTTFITTGFFVNGCMETDGPPGSIILARALKEIGFSVLFVTDSECKKLLINVFGNEFEIIEFPLLDAIKGKEFADSLITEYSPQLLISIERCGFTRDGFHKNMKGVDISKITADVDFLFQNPIPSIGIGDGGNEIGMGNLYDDVKSIASLVTDPSAIKTTKLLIASVSNWGGYALTTALSELTNHNMLPTKQNIWEIVKTVVDMGGVDGLSGEHVYRVDGFSEDIEGEVVDLLHEYLIPRLNSPKTI